MPDAAFYTDNDFGQLSLDLLIEFGIDATLVHTTASGLAGSRRKVVAGVPVTHDIKYVPGEVNENVNASPNRIVTTVTVFFSGKGLPFEPNTVETLFRTTKGDHSILALKPYLYGLDDVIIWEADIIK